MARFHDYCEQRTFEDDMFHRQAIRVAKKFHQKLKERTKGLKRVITKVDKKTWIETFA